MNNFLGYFWAIVFPPFFFITRRLYVHFLLSLAFIYFADKKLMPIGKEITATYGEGIGMAFAISIGLVFFLFPIWACRLHRLIQKKRQAKTFLGLAAMVESRADEMRGDKPRPIDVKWEKRKAEWTKQSKRIIFF